MHIFCSRVSGVGNKSEFMRYDSSILLMVLFAGFAGAQSFNLWIPQKKIPVLKSRAESAEFRTEWSNYLAKADQLCDPLSANYADPAGVTEGGEDGMGHIVARRMIYWMEMLGTSYRLTGDAKYCNHGITLLLSCAQQLTLSSTCMARAYYGAYGDMMRGLATGYDFFAADMTELQRAQVLQTSGTYLEDFIRTASDSRTWWRPYHNFAGVCGGAAGLVALQLRDTYPDAGVALQQVVLQIKEWLDYGFDDQGANYEGVLYSIYGLENVFLFADILKQTGGEDLFENPALQKLINYYIQSAIPGEKTLDARNDSLYEHNPSTLLLKIASEYNDGTAMWLYENRPSVTSYNTWSPGISFFLQLLWANANEVSPVTPQMAGVPLAEYFQGRGLCTWRTGWKSDDAMLSVEAGKYYIVTHNQADKGHFTFYGYGYKWACDTGYANNNTPDGRAQTVAHNCVLIDGLGQARSGAGLGTTGQILSYTNTAFYGHAVADCSDAYRRYYYFGGDRLNYPDGIPVEHMTLDHAYRHTIFIRKTDTTPSYAVVLDDINKDGAIHDYRWQMLSWPDLNIEPGDKSAVVFPATNNPTDVKMHVFFDAETDPVVTSDSCTLADGIAPSTFPRLSASCRAVNPYFASVLIPLAGTAPPQVRFEETSSLKTIFVEWPEKTDRIVWNKAGGLSQASVQFLRSGADDFNRADTLLSCDGRIIGDVWSNSRPDAKWGIADGQIVAESGLGAAVLYNTSLKTISGNGTNFTLRADIKGLVANAWAGMVFNFKDALNYYYLRIKGNAPSYQMIRVVSGVETRVGAAENLAAGVFSTNTAYTLKVSSSNVYEFFFTITDAATGAVVASGLRTDEAFSFTGGYGGFQYYNTLNKARFDNFDLSIGTDESEQPAGADDFNRVNTSMSTDGSVIGEYWRNSRTDAKWGIAGGQIVAGAGTTAAVLYNTLLETTSGNGAGFVLSADIKGLVSNAWSGVSFNFQDPQNYYYLRIKTGAPSYQMIRVVSGLETRMGAAGNLSSGIFSTNTAYTLTVSSSNAYEFSFAITDAKTGTLMASGSRIDDASSFSGGYAGLHYFNSTDKARFDNFSLKITGSAHTSAGLLFLLKGTL
jgi:hypothetical protein